MTFLLLYLAKKLRLHHSRKLLRIFILTKNVRGTNVLLKSIKKRYGIVHIEAIQLIRWSQLSHISAIKMLLSQPSISQPHFFTRVTWFKLYCSLIRGAPVCIYNLQLKVNNATIKEEISQINKRNGKYTQGCFKALKKMCEAQQIY